MKKSWKIIILSGLLLIIVWIGLSIFKNDLRFLKERYLIKRNFHHNKLLFSKVIPILDTLPKIDINFRGDSMIVLEIEKRVPFSDTVDSYVYNYPPTISISKVGNDFSIGNYLYPLSDFWFTDSILFISTPDSLFRVYNEWIIRYDGYRNDTILDKILAYEDLNEQRIADIQKILKEINCSGVEKIKTGNFIINYRTNYYLFDAFSYEIIPTEQDTTDIANEFYSRRGKLDDNIYWFHYCKNPLVEYFGYLKLNNWNK